MEIQVPGNTPLPGSHSPTDAQDEPNTLTALSAAAAMRNQDLVSS